MLRTTVEAPIIDSGTLAGFKTNDHNEVRFDFVRQGVTLHNDGLTDRQNLALH